MSTISHVDSRLKPGTDEVERPIASLRLILGQLATIPDEEWEFARHLLRVRVLNKGDLFQKQGERPECFAFIHQGLLRTCATSPAGDEATLLIARENSFIGAYQDFLLGQHSSQFIVAEEKSVLVTASMDIFDLLEKRHQCWSEIRRKKVEGIMQRLLRREFQFQNLSAEDRYDDFITREPGLAARVDQWKIASYIGVSPEALSRIRARKTKRGT
jgi:CRP-like cAMP-binding protein